MKLTHWVWTLRIWARAIWARIAILSALALVSAGVSSISSGLLPDHLSYEITEDAVARLLSILSNSMLTVTTFSLSVMVAAHHYASSQATPRAHRLLRGDGRTQTVLATFMGAFVYAIMSIVMLNAGAYSDRDFIIVYFFTILVIAIVIVAMVRWIEHLSGLGSMEQTEERVEDVTIEALKLRLSCPCLGGVPLIRRDTIPDAAAALLAENHGYVRYVDAVALNDLAEESNGDIWVIASPGDWVDPGDPLLRMAIWGITDEQEKKLREAVVIGDARSYDQDPQFGIQVLSEIAQRALSPGINDPRTAIAVLLRILRILTPWEDEAIPRPEPDLPRLHVKPMTALDLVFAGFDFIARDGAQLVEVQMQVQRALARLARHDSAEMREAARIVSRRALAFSDDALLLAEDRARVHAVSPHRSDEAAAPT
ncbi:hypothetical protein OCGS_1893 [Oceaniovalibus guishaninsula JLT2003]|uniref:DUF2254 domain-containing protein n=1 Tax=Oceaniovalibus guishaninsula JLT2003 TaxID=1231392 RepID=K2HB91_9RHOB|nr:DUF2254 domain-containing protein [Oceaniovalibus guishaninsula]EKE43912.1 hypothetical protein OCGS_1893 [Oceaniovalibus guishaninsula JLT2003]